MSTGIPYLRFRRPTPRQLATQNGRRMALRRLALEWLCNLPQPPTGFACDVPVKGSGNRADLAAFWSAQDPDGVLRPVRTMAIICALNRQECWAAGINADSLALELRDLHRRIGDMEAEIRRNEPGLRDAATLFEEYAEWDYSKSANPEYHQAVRHCHILESRLFHGTRSDRLCASGTLDEVYVAVPAGTLLEGETIGDCGLLEMPLDAGEPVRLLRPAVRVAMVAVSRRQQLVQSIAAAASAYVRAGHGLPASSRRNSGKPARPESARKP